MLTVNALIDQENYLTKITAGDNSIIADEPEKAGGGDQGPNPKELIAAGLASCTAITLRMYTDRKEWNVGKISVNIDMDTSNLDTAKFIRRISIEHSLDEERHQRLIAIANACPVHKILSGSVSIETVLL